MGKQVSYTQLRDSYNYMLPVWTHGGQYYPAPTGMPNEVKILGRHFRVLYHSKIYAEKKKASRLLGIVIFNHQVIMLEPGQTIHMLRQSLYHEIGHIYLEAAKLRGGALAKLTNLQVEELCDMFGDSVPDLVGNNTIST